MTILREVVYNPFRNFLADNFQLQDEFAIYVLFIFHFKRFFCSVWRNFSNSDYNRILVGGFLITYKKRKSAEALLNQI
jgi:hypothetical protein